MTVQPISTSTINRMIAMMGTSSALASRPVDATDTRTQVEQVRTATQAPPVDKSALTTQDRALVERLVEQDVAVRASCIAPQTSPCRASTLQARELHASLARQQTTPAGRFIDVTA